MAEFWRALRTLKALQAEQAARPEHAAAAEPALAEPAIRPAARLPRAQVGATGRTQGRRASPTLCSVQPTALGPTLHEPAAPWRPNEPETGSSGPAASDRPGPVVR